MNLREQLNNGRHFMPSLGNTLTILAMLGAVGVSWFTLAGETARNKDQIEAVKKQMDDDKRDAREDRADIKRDVKETKGNVELILRKLEGMEATQRERDRRSK